MADYELSRRGLDGEMLPDSFDQLLDRLMTRREEVSRSLLAKEGFMAVREKEEAVGDEMIASLSR